MKEVTNKQLFITMIIIGVVTIGLLLPLYRSSVYRYSYVNNNNSSFPTNLLQANSYSSYSGDIAPSINSSGVYIPTINTNYPVSAFRTSATRSVYTETPLTPRTTTRTYYYTSNTNSQNNGTSYYNNDGGYVPAGCEGGTDYSTTTNEPCG
jgi:hypothetical protein